MYIHGAGVDKCIGPLVIIGMEIEEIPESLLEFKILNQETYSKFHQVFIKEKENLKLSYRVVTAQEINEKGKYLAIREKVENIIEDITIMNRGVQEVYISNQMYRTHEDHKTISEVQNTKVVKILELIAKYYYLPLYHNLCKEYKKYEIEKHQGYLNFQHLKIIGKYGLTKEHREQDVLERAVKLIPTILVNNTIDQNKEDVLADIYTRYVYALPVWWINLEFKVNQRRVDTIVDYYANSYKQLSKFVKEVLYVKINRKKKSKETGEKRKENYELSLWRYIKTKEIKIKGYDEWYDKLPKVEYTELKKQDIVNELRER